MILTILKVYEIESFKITPGFAKEALKSHNHYRGLHRAPPLKIDNAISAIAKKSADAIVNSKLKHTNKTYNGKKLGENLSMWSLSMTNSSGLMIAFFSYLLETDFLN